MGRLEDYVASLRASGPVYLVYHVHWDDGDMYIGQTSKPCLETYLWRRGIGGTGALGKKMIACGMPTKINYRMITTNREEALDYERMLIQSLSKKYGYKVRNIKHHVSRRLWSIDCEKEIINA